MQYLWGKVHEVGRLVVEYNENGDVCLTIKIRETIGPQLSGENKCGNILPENFTFTPVGRNSLGMISWPVLRFFRQGWLYQ